MNHKLLVYITAFAILQPNILQAKTKIKKPRETAPQIIAQPIESSYFLQIDLAENDCEKFLQQSSEQNCLFRDKMNEEPYFHQTILTIFLDKVFATQHYNDKTKLLQVKDGNYSAISQHNNLISFTTKNGEITNLELISGDITKEQNNVSKCQKSENLYNFYNIYGKNDQISLKSRLYKDEYNFDGIQEYIMFSEKKTPAEIMALSKDGDGKISAINNIRICKMPNSDILNVRHINDEECASETNFAEECIKYLECEDKIIVEECEVNLFKDGFN